MLAVISHQLAEEILENKLQFFWDTIVPYINYQREILVYHVNAQKNWEVVWKLLEKIVKKLYILKSCPYC